MTRVRAAFERLQSENGTTLIEVAVASAILLVIGRDNTFQIDRMS